MDGTVTALENAGKTYLTEDGRFTVIPYKDGEHRIDTGLILSLSYQVFQEPPKTTASMMGSY